MEQDKPRARVKVFTRSEVLCSTIKRDRELMKTWWEDKSIPLHIGSAFSRTEHQKNYFYNYREGN